MRHRFLIALTSATALGLPGVASASCGSDLNNDGLVGVDDLIRLILDWGACAAPCGSDLNGDGTVDSGDIADVVSEWGACPCTPDGHFVDNATGATWDPADGYVLGSGVDLRLVVECADPDDVVFQIWSNGIVAPMADFSSPYVYDGSVLVSPEVPPGTGIVQALLRRDGQPPFAVLEFETTFSLPPAVCGNGACEVGEGVDVCPADCDGTVAASLLFDEDFELGDYSRWGWEYIDWSACASNGYTSAHAVSGAASHRSTIACTDTQSHRGYGLLRFDGDETVPNFQVPSDGGIDTPFGIVVSYWSRLEVPYPFGNGKWISFMTVVDDCSNNWNGVLTVNIDDATGRLKPVHVSAVQYQPDAPPFPLGQWVRTTVYVNYYTEQMHVWQNGEKIASALFSRPGATACQFHFGLYASGPNDDIVLHEDDIRIWKLLAPLPELLSEPVPGP